MLSAEDTAAAERSIAHTSHHSLRLLLVTMKNKMFGKMGTSLRMGSTPSDACCSVMRIIRLGEKYIEF